MHPRVPETPGREPLPEPARARRRNGKRESRRSKPAQECFTRPTKTTWESVSSNYGALKSVAPRGDLRPLAPCTSAFLQAARTSRATGTPARLSAAESAPSHAGHPHIRGRGPGATCRLIWGPKGAHGDVGGGQGGREGPCSAKWGEAARAASGHVLRGRPSPKSLATMQRGAERQREATTLFTSRFYPRTSHFPLQEGLIHIYRSKLSRPPFERKKRSSAIDLKFALNSHLPREPGLRSPARPAGPPV